MLEIGLRAIELAFGQESANVQQVSVGISRLGRERFPRQRDRHIRASLHQFQLAESNLRFGRARVQPQHFPVRRNRGGWLSASHLDPAKREQRRRRVGMTFRRQGDARERLVRPAV